ncbi:ATP-binding protein [Glaciecola sp. 2405UD65-10]|uniref:ATP-binding protein n=1 Tax=Glaciecola sp. 2405UD65-10 TaxID=3397244 RepID=UPI003B5C81F1
MNKLFRSLRRINPQHSLFGRIFLWFWLAVSVMVIGAFTVARFLGDTWELSATTDAHLADLQSTAANVQKLLNKNTDFERALRRVGARTRAQLLLIDPENKHLFLGFPRPMLSQTSKFIDLVNASEPLVIRTKNMEFIGPIAVSANGKPLYLFSGRLLRHQQRPFMVLGSALVVFLVLGTLACVGIAFTIVKPIKRLQELSNDFATGYSQEPDPHLAKRKDELGQLHEDIYKMASNLALSLRQQKDLMANVSHELRTPLTRMQLALAMLNPEGNENNPYGARIEKEIGVMDSLIGQSLQLAKMDSQLQHSLSQKQSCLLSDILTPMFDDLIFEAKASGKQLIINECPELTLMLNKASFVSAIENVTRNAIKFCESTVQINMEQNEKNAHSILSIVIEDNGEGLPLEQAKQIFEPFYRAPSGNEVQGTGLGLAIAKAAVELHQGQIDVYESAMGGLKIALNFPLTTAKLIR